MEQLLRVQNFVVSRDGFGAGEGQSLERPFGHADPGALMAWAGATASWPNRTEPGGTRGLDDYFTRDFSLTAAAVNLTNTKRATNFGLDTLPRDVQINDRMLSLKAQLSF